MHGLTRKWLHRQVAEGFLPKEIVRRRKRGFASTIVDDWYRSVVGGRTSELLLVIRNL